MSLRKIIASIFRSPILTDVERVVQTLAPTVAADLIAFSATLPPVFASLEAMAVQAIKLVHDVHGITISKGIAIALAQKVFTEQRADIVSEAAGLLTKLEAK